MPPAPLALSMAKAGKPEMISVLFSGRELTTLTRPCYNLHPLPFVALDHVDGSNTSTAFTNAACIFSQR